MVAEGVVERGIEAGRRATPVAGGVALIWAVGILIRLVLMPFTFHVDLYQVYSRAADAVYHGQWLSWDSQLVIQMVHNISLFLIRPLLPGADGIWSTTAGTMGLGAQGSDVARFLAYPELARALFLLKLPYLVADLGTGYLLTRLVEPVRRPRVLALWLLNPLVIYVCAVFGRHDPIAIFLVVASLAVTLRSRRVLGLGLLGVAALARVFPAFLAPVFVMTFRRSRREFLLLTGGLVGVWLAVEVPIWALTGSSPTLTLLSRYPHVDFLVALAAPIGGGEQFFVFPVAYALLLFWYYDRRPSRARDYVVAGAVVFQVVFALTYFHPQYTVWLVPLLVLAIDRHGRLIGYHLAQVALLYVYSLRWGGQTTWDLLAPLGSPAIAGLPDPRTVIGAAVDPDLFFGVVRAFFSAVSLWIAYSLLRERWPGRRQGGSAVTAGEDVESPVRRAGHPEPVEGSGFRR